MFMSIGAIFAARVCTPTRRRCGTTRPTGADMAAMAAAGTLPPTIAAAGGQGMLRKAAVCVCVCVCVLCL